MACSALSDYCEQNLARTQGSFAAPQLASTSRLVRSRYACSNPCPSLAWYHRQPRHHPCSPLSRDRIKLQTQISNLPISWAASTHQNYRFAQSRRLSSSMTHLNWAKRSCTGLDQWYTSQLMHSFCAYVSILQPLWYFAKTCELHYAWAQTSGSPTKEFAPCGPSFGQLTIQPMNSCRARNFQATLYASWDSSYAAKARNRARPSYH